MNASSKTLRVVLLDYASYMVYVFNDAENTNGLLMRIDLNLTV